MPKSKRTNYSTEKKIAVLRQHLLEEVPVSQLCEEHGFAPNVFYAWQRQFFENGHLAFERKTSKRSLDSRDRQIKDLEEKLAKKNEVLSEAVEALIEAKKLSGGH